MRQVRTPRWSDWLVATLVVVSCGCGTAPDLWKAAKPGQVKVLASFPPIFSLATTIGGDQAYVQCLLTATGPHDYKYTNTDAFYFRGADLVLCNGLELDEHFIDRLARSAGTSRQKIVRLGNLLPEKMLVEGECHHVHKDDEHHHHGFDPHVWLGPPHLQKIADTIAEKLAALAPAHKDEFQKRADEIKRQIQTIQTDGQAAVKGKKNRKIITTHESLKYFGDGIGIEIVGSIQTTPGQEADAANLARLVKLCQDKEVAVITVEPQYPKAQAETLRDHLQKKGMKIKIVEIDPLETANAVADSRKPDPKMFLEKYRENVKTLVEALP